MTQQQKSELERAILRAGKRGIHILGVGTRKADGARVFLTNSGSHRDGTHWVVVSGGHLTCDCVARTYCVHRAVCHQRLAAERQAREDAERTAHAIRAAQAIYAGQRGAVARQCEPKDWLDANERARQRETAPLARNDAPISIWR